jgi:hypothetical protein
LVEGGDKAAGEGGGTRERGEDGGGAGVFVAFADVVVDAEGEGGVADLIAAEDILEFGGEIDVIFAVFGECPARIGVADIEGEAGGVEDLVLDSRVDLADDVADDEAGEGEAGDGRGGRGDDAADGEEIVEGGGVEGRSETVKREAPLGDDGVGKGGDDEGFGAERASDLGGEAEIGDEFGGAEIEGAAEVSAGPAVEIRVVAAFYAEGGDRGRIVKIRGHDLGFGVEKDIHVRLGRVSKGDGFFYFATN